MKTHLTRDVMTHETNDSYPTPFAALSVEQAMVIDARLRVSLPPQQTNAVLGLIDQKNLQVVHVAGLAAGTGADIMAFDTALIAAQAGNQRVLIIETAARSYYPPLLHLRNRAPRGIAAYIRAQTDQPLLVQARETNLFYTFVGASSETDGLPMTAILSTFVARMRDLFDLVIIHSDQLSPGGAAIAAAGISDGVIMVVEAEQTRLPVATKAKEDLTAAGATILGAVLYNRRRYIAPWLYRQLFAGKSATE